MLRVLFEGDGALVPIPTDSNLNYFRHTSVYTDVTQLKRGTVRSEECSPNLPPLGEMPDGQNCRPRLSLPTTMLPHPFPLRPSWFKVPPL